MSRKVLAAAAVLILLSTTVVLIRTVIAEDAPSRETETWTVLAYMNGDSNLESDLLNDIDEMERVGSSENVNIVVQIDRSDGNDRRDGDWEDARRYLIKKDLEDGINSERLDTDPPLGEVEMNDPETLREFLVWGLMSYPAQHYMIIMGGHARGPVLGLMRDESSTLGSGQMRTDEMGEAIRSAIDETIARPVDIISFDVCWMGMAEAAAEIMDHSRYMVGSFDLIDAAGWPYDLCLPHILDGSLTMEERLTDVINTYTQFYVGSKSFISLSAVDLSVFRDRLIPAWSQFSEELFYTAFDQRSLYSSIVQTVDMPSGKDGSDTNDRYMDLYQFTEYIAQDPRTPSRVRTSAHSVLETEKDVLVHLDGGANHPSDSRMFGIYLPEVWDDPKYEQLAMGQLTPWDDLVRLYVRELDLRPQGYNWSTEKPSSITFILRTSTGTGISQAWVEVVTGSGYQNVTLIGSGGLYSGTMVISGLDGFDYRYRVVSVMGGTVDLPPDGSNEVRFETELEPPEAWHEPPPVVNVGLDGGGLTFFLRDDTGIEKQVPEKVPRLIYRQLGKPTWYSKPLVEISKDTFTGWTEFWESPTGVEPGMGVEYRIDASDVLGNTAVYPASGYWTSTMGIGARFFLDGAHSNIESHGALIREFMDLGMAVDMGQEGEPYPNLDDYKGYLLIKPSGVIDHEEAQSISSFALSGGEVLVLMDPGDEGQTGNAGLLLEAFGITPSREGSVSGFYPKNPSSELGSDIPSITGSYTGSFVVGSGQTPAYYSQPPEAVLLTGWSGSGRTVVSIPALFDDSMMSREANRNLADRVISYLHKNMRPEVVFTVDPDGVVKPGQTVRIDLGGSSDRDGEVVLYSISMSDNTYLESSDPVFDHIFSKPGVFSLLLKVYDAEGEEGLLTHSIRVNRPPSSEVGVSSLRIHSGEEITFTYKGSDPDGDDHIVEWDFGDGFKVSGKVVRHTYMMRGEYTYRMVVKDIWGLESSREGVITVENSFPVAVIDKDNIVVNGHPGNFSGELKITMYVNEGDRVVLPGGLSSDNDRNDVLQFDWNMGDGTHLNGSVADHIYTTSGLLLVNLTVTDGNGGFDHSEMFISVENRAPFAIFDISKDGDTMVFDASLSTDDPWDLEGLVYIWDLGDGNTRRTSGPHLRYDYTFGGDYRVKLTVKDSDGASSSFTRDVSAEGMTIEIAVSLIVAITVVLLVALLVVWRKLKDKMVREDRGLIDIIKGVKKEPEEDVGQPRRGFSRPVRVRRREPPPPRTREFSPPGGR
ncbi:MAG: PKD domain-containing protein [Thermoplasmatota archaeon]